MVAQLSWIFAINPALIPTSIFKKSGRHFKIAGTLPKTIYIYERYSSQPRRKYYMNGCYSQLLQPYISQFGDPWIYQLPFVSYKHTRTHTYA